MNTTTNYGLKQYEGTDLFNPLTVENVNMGDIDTTMKAISNHSVGAATELTTGTVHAITRADTDRNVFLFVATSNFTAGDTFTLDGNQVSALTPDGQQLATGSYVIGSSVLCALHDTLITVYVNPAKAKDADMLDGHDSSYYATDSDLDTVAGTIGAISDKVGSAVLTTTAPDLSGAVNELNTQLSSLITPESASVNFVPTTTFKSALNALGAVLDFNKLTQNAKLVVHDTVSNGKTILSVISINYNATYCSFGLGRCSSTGAVTAEYDVSPTSSTVYSCTGSSFLDSSNTPINSTGTITIYYR